MRSGRAGPIRVEGLIDPVGVDAPSPRLTWSERGDGADDTIDVVLTDGEGVVWSDRVPLGAGRVEVPVGVLAPLTEYRCRVGDVAAGRFVTGLRASGAWSAPWVAASGGADGAVAVTGRIDRSPDGDGRAWLAVTALGVYRAHVNGERVSDEELAPGWTDYTRRVRYRLHDITALRRGGDEVELWLAPGWYAGHIGAHGPRRYGDRPAISAQVIHVARGRQTVLAATDADWSWTPLGRPRADLVMGETVIAPRPVGAPATVVVVEPSGPVVEADPLPPVRPIADVAPVIVTEPEPGVFVADFGRIVTGRLRLSVPGAGVVTAMHGEALGTDGRVYTANLRSAEQRDEFVVGDGGATVEPAFTFHGFRYAELTGWPGVPEPSDVTAVVLATSMRSTGSIVVSDPAVRQLVDNIASSALGNAVGIPTDCPQRDERLGWTADISVFAPTLGFLVDAEAFLAGWVTALIDGQRADGAVPHVAPVVAEYGFDAPVWGDAIVDVPWQLWRRYGDDRTLRQAFDPMRRWLDYCLAQCDDGIRPARALADWLAPGAVQTPAELIATGALAHSLDVVARVAAVLGEAGDGFVDEAAKVKAAFRREFFEGGRLHAPTQTGYSLALVWELLEPEQRVQAAAALADLVAADGYRLTTGFVGTPLLLPALSANGHHHVAARIFNQEGYPSWRYQLRAGATTMWERWDSWHHRRGMQTPTMNSFNHYAYGCVGDWLVRHVAGIGDDPGGSSGGFSQLRMRPQPLPLMRQMHARYESTSGPVESGWRVEHDVTQFVATVPNGVDATLRLPVAGAWDTLTVNGTFLLGLGETLPLTRAADGSCELALPPGRWSFTAATPPALLDAWDGL